MSRMETPASFAARHGAQLRSHARGIGNTGVVGTSAMAKHRKDPEFDLHVWKKPESANCEALYTVSLERHSICVDAPIGKALDAMREWLENA